MLAQNRKLHSNSGLWLLSAMVGSILLLPVAARGQEKVVPEMKPRPRVPIYETGAPVQKKVLKNGLTILVQEHRTSERVAAAVADRLGAMYEPDEDAGRGQGLIKAIVTGTETHPPVELALRLLAADAKAESGAGPGLG